LFATAKNCSSARIFSSADLAKVLLKMVCWSYKSSFVVGEEHQQRREEKAKIIKNEKGLIEKLGAYRLFLNVAANSTGDMGHRH